MVTREEFENATRRAERRKKSQPRATVVGWQAATKKIVIGLSSGVELSFSPCLVQGLENGKEADFLNFEISAAGLGIHFPTLDADIYLPGLLSGLLGSRKWMAAQMGADGGRSRSKAKQKAAKVNGSKGGRPSKVKELAAAS